VLRSRRLNRHVSVDAGISELVETSFAPSDGQPETIPSFPQSLIGKFDLSGDKKVKFPITTYRDEYEKSLIGVARQSVPSD
jgi:hypothetical protein